MTDRIFIRDQQDGRDVPHAYLNEVGWVVVEDEDREVQTLLAPDVVREIHLNVEDATGGTP